MINAVVICSNEYLGSFECLCLICYLSVPKYPQAAFERSQLQRAGTIANTETLIWNTKILAQDESDHVDGPATDEEIERCTEI